MDKPHLPFQCDLAALLPEGASPSPALIAEARARAERVTAQVFSTVVVVRELPDGYRLQLRDSRETLAAAATFVEIDRRCCGFLRHSITVEADGGPLWLELTGREGAKEAIASDLVRFLPEGVRPS